MKRIQKSGPCDSAVRATDLAEMGFCEKQVELKHRYGLQTTSARELSIARGRREHQRYFDEGTKLERASGPIGASRIANSILCKSTSRSGLLQRDRDPILHCSPWRRTFAHGWSLVVSLGYVLLRWWPKLPRPTRAGLNRLVSKLRDLASSKG